VFQAEKRKEKTPENLYAENERENVQRTKRRHEKTCRCSMSTAGRVSSAETQVQERKRKQAGAEPRAGRTPPPPEKSE